MGNSRLVIMTINDHCGLKKCGGGVRVGENKR